MQLNNRDEGVILKNNNIERLVIETKIGTCIKEINKVSGGLSHRMYKVVTDKGIYAIKELNSGVMKRKEAFSNFIFSEKVSEIAIQNKNIFIFVTYS